MAGKFDLETTTLAQLLADPEAKAIIDDVVPELPNHPMIGFVKNLPVTQLLKMAGGQVPADTIAVLTQRIGAL